MCKKVSLIKKENQELFCQLVLFIQVTTFKSKEGTLTTRDVMITSVMSGHVACEPRRLSNQAIFLPRDLTPCAFQGCSNIALDYELEVKRNEKIVMEELLHENSSADFLYLLSCSSARLNRLKGV